MMLPDFETAALKASEILLKFRISTAPISPLPILKASHGVLVVSYAEMATTVGSDRRQVVSAFGERNQDAVTSVSSHGGNLRYVVAYNQRLPLYLLQRALARELGHIVLEHDGTRPEAVREAEALCFSRHLLCPRPLLQAVHDAGLPLTVDVVGNLTGCFERCQAGIRKTPGVHVPAEINRLVRDQFADYVENFVSFMSAVRDEDESALADLGTYMDFYEE